jgi:hypothetical protein
MWERKVAVIGLAQNAFASLEADRAMLVAERDALRKEVERLRRDRDDALATMRDLQSALRQVQETARARQQADAELLDLYRRREAEQAFVARDPTVRLH